MYPESPLAEYAEVSSVAPPPRSSYATKAILLGCLALTLEFSALVLAFAQHLPLEVAFLLVLIVAFTWWALILGYLVALPVAIAGIILSLRGTREAPLNGWLMTGYFLNGMAILGWTTPLVAVAWFR